MKPTDLLKIFISIIFPILLGPPLIFVGEDAIRSVLVDFKMPSFTLPSWMFPLAWVYIFGGIGISFWMVWELPKSADRRKAFQLLILQFLFNLVWNFAFFYYRNFVIALIILVAMWFFAVLMTLRIYKLNRMAAILSLPYLIWRTYNIPLVFSIIVLNS